MAGVDHISPSPRIQFARAENRFISAYHQSSAAAAYHEQAYVKHNRAG